MTRRTIAYQPALDGVRAFAVTAAFYVIALVLVFVMYDERDVHHELVKDRTARLSFRNVLAFENFILLMAVIMAIVVVIGTALDFAPTLMILTPVLMPIIKQAGIDPIYFGVLFIINNSIGLITPPVGIVLNVVCGISKISMSELMDGLWPFLWAELIVLFLLVLFPSLVLVPLKWLM